MAGINSKQPFGGIPAADYSLKGLAEELGTHQQTIVAIKSGRRALSVDLARKVAVKSGEVPATLYLTSQVAAIKNKVKTKAMTPKGSLVAAEQILRAIKGQFYPHEIDRGSAEFKAAAEQLRQIAIAALDMSEDEDKQMGQAAGSGNDAGVVYAMGDSVAPALKSTRDVYGRRIPEGEPVERDGYGRRVR
jgi:DNA-binding XRE family transcriptional regulator